MKPTNSANKLPTKKKGGVTINPKKEDLMSESFRKRFQAELDALKESAKKKDKHIKAAKAGKTLTAMASGMSQVKTLRKKKSVHLLRLTILSQSKKQRIA